jgi:hypothetical protein
MLLLLIVFFFLGELRIFTVFNVAGLRHRGQRLNVDVLLD